MPNWVYNTLTVEGTPAIVNKIKEQLNTPFTRVHEQWDMKTGQMEKQTVTFSNPVFSFWNIVKPTDLDAYEKQTDHANSPSVSDNFAEYMKWTATQNDWYNWNINNWGTKWDVAVSDGEQYPNTELIHDEPNGENHVLVYRFNTAWSRPMTALLELSKQYPVLFTLVYEEETGWGGETEILRGEVTAESEYETKCPECDAIDVTEWNEELEVNVCSDCGYQS